jgi:centromere-localized protein 2
LQLSGHGRRKNPHTLQTIHPDIQKACKSIEAEIQEMESDIDQTLSEVREAIGELSDLRYGNLPRPAGGENISEEVLATLKRLEAVCSNSTG